MASQQLDLIQADFKLLQHEFRKKSQQIRESVEKALEYIDFIKKQPPQASQENINIAPGPLLEPLQLLFEAKISKTFQLGLNLLQKINQSFNCTQSQTILQIIRILKEACSEGLDEMTEIRVLQMTLMLLDPQTITLSRELVRLVMQSCFQIMDTKSMAVKSTIQATLRQLMSILVDTFLSECKQAVLQTRHHDLFSLRKREVALTAAEQNQISELLREQFAGNNQQNAVSGVERGGESTLVILQDVIQNLAFTVLKFDQRSGKKPLSLSMGQIDQSGLSNDSQVLKFKSSTFSKCVVLDALNYCLTSTNDLIRFFPELLSIFELQLCPTIEPMLSQKQHGQSGLGMRLMKCAILIVNNLGCGFNLLRSLIADSDSFVTQAKDGTYSANLSWRALIGFECLQLALANPVLTQILATSSLSIGAPALIQILESFLLASKAIERAFLAQNGPQFSNQANSKGHRGNAGSNRAGYQTMQNIPKVIHAQNLEGEVPLPTLAQIERILLESIFSFTEKFCTLQPLKTPQQQEKEKKQGGESQMNHEKMQRDMLVLCWKTLYEIIQRLLKSTHDESNIQILLKAIQNCIAACGQANCYEARDAFLKVLCAECVSPKTNSGAEGAGQSSKEQAKQKAITVSQQQSSASGSSSRMGTNKITEEFTINERNVLICKTFFNIAHNLCQILDVKSWFLLLETMQKMEAVINQKLQTQGLKLHKDRPAFNQDGNQLIINFNELKKRVDQKMSTLRILERQRNQHKPGNHHSSVFQSQTSMASVESSSAFDATEVSAQDSNNSLAHSLALKVKSSITGRPSRTSIVSQQEETKGSDGEVQNDIFQPDLASSSLHQARSMDSFQADLRILHDNFDSLFSSTLLIDIQSLAELICALAQLTVGVLENFSSPSFMHLSRSQAAEGEILAQINTFAMTRLVETALVNVSRIESIWKIIVAHFDILSNCQVLAIRQLTIEALQTIVLAVFGHKKAITIQNPKTENDSAKNIRESVAVDMVSNEDVTSEENNLDTSKYSEHSQSSQGSSVRSGRGADESWTNSMWQYTVLVPLSEQLKSTHIQDKTSVLKGFEKIIQTCGPQIKNEGWRIVIVTISKSLENESEQIVACGFRCLKLVVSNHINRLSQANFVTVLNAIHMYASKIGSNINNNLQAIGMFQNVADYAAKQICKRSTPSNSQVEPASSAMMLSVGAAVGGMSKINFDKIWDLLFERINNLGASERSEVRKTTVITLENIVMTHGQVFQASKAWPKVLNETVLAMLQHAIDRYTSPQKSSREDQDTVQTNESSHANSSNSSNVHNHRIRTSAVKPKMNFETESMRKQLEQNDSSWGETCTILVTSAFRCIKKFLEATQCNHTTDMIQQNWTQLMRLINTLIGLGSVDVAQSIFKSLQDFMASNLCCRLFLSVKEVPINLFWATCDLIASEINLSSQIKADKARSVKLMKFCPLVVDMLLKVFTEPALESLSPTFDSPFEQSVKSKENTEDFSSEATTQQNEVQNNQFFTLLVDPEFCESLLALFQSLLNTSQHSESVQSFNLSHKLLMEERAVFDFIEQIGPFFLQDTATFELYLDFLFQMIEFKGMPRSQAFIKRTLNIFYLFIIRGIFTSDILKKLLPDLFKRIKELIDLRYDSQACINLGLGEQKQTNSLNLFQTVGLYLIHISSFLVNPKQFVTRLINYKEQQKQINQASKLNIDISEEATPNYGRKSFGQVTSGTKIQDFGPSNQSKMAQQTSLTSAQKIKQGVMQKPIDMLFCEHPDFQIPCEKEFNINAYQSEVELKEQVWQKSLSLVQSTLLFDVKKVKELKTAILLEVGKSSQDLDMQVMNFILNALLPNSGFASKVPGEDAEAHRVMEQSLVQIIDKGCSNQAGYGLSAQSSLNSPVLHNISLSRFCFTNMFQLCRYQSYTAYMSEKETNIVESSSSLKGHEIDNVYQIRVKIAKIATPVLINRCLQTLRKFIKDEAKVGAVGIPKQRVNEIVFILENLRDLDSWPPGITHTEPDQNIIFKKGHLIELMPILSELIARNEQTIKESLKNIFLEISKQLNQTLGPNLANLASITDPQQKRESPAGIS